MDRWTAQNHNGCFHAKADCRSNECMYQHRRWMCNTHMLLHGWGEGYFLPLTLWGMVGFGIQPWGRIDQVLL